MSALVPTAIVRWLKFNLVGAVGTAVQLGSLAVFNRVAAGHYMWASATALELTLLHNFVWHVRYTWRDRRGSVGPQLVRFHLSNGVVSMVGNLGLMRVLVHGAGMPVVAANAVAIVCCGLANFCLGEGWAFAAKRPVAG
jgi:putative flippase GtrA